MKFLSILLGASMLAIASATSSLSRPNIIMILTDDQDVHMHSLDYMPLLQKHLMHEGTTFTRHFCTIALCCPSRATLLTGKAAHNTNVTDIITPHGGYPKWVSEGHNDNYLPVWLQALGYDTYYVGKLFNQHDVDNYDEEPAKGWTQSDFLLDPYTYQYENAHFSRNGGKPVSYKGQYSPDVTTEKMHEFLDMALDKEEPFFLGVAPIAPHANMIPAPLEATPPVYAKRHAHLFKDYKIPRTDNFNPDTPSGVSWVAQLPQLNDTVIDYNDEYQRCRLRALQSVDEMVESLVHRLKAAGVMDNTYIFYTTDNGYHISQHRMHPGKECGFDTDIHIPLIVRGPGVARGVKSMAVTAHSDLAPTFLNLASGAAFGGDDIVLENAPSAVPRLADLDGGVIPLLEDTQPSDSTKTEHVNIEFWGNAAGEGKYGFHGDWGVINTTVNGYVNNTYKGLRLIGEGYNLYYTVWCTNEHELYNVERDPGQVRNLLSSSVLNGLTASSDLLRIAGRPLAAVLDRLDALMMVLKSCKGDVCRHPWDSLHPKSRSSKVPVVNTLVDALDEQFDAFYAGQPKVRFDKCELGYIPSSEGPQHVSPFGKGNYNAANDDQVRLGHWSEWV
ncbi:hypothetical protein SEUCBS140593_003005 [Sporothrix eucalyptigena]|uniref:Arylsulfatase n=1 Tax=Sporothrix eucalyptigena TaxID=1812306 RepID=A0ABP0BB85_9PEZI